MARALAATGGRTLVVGGWVRDVVLGRAPGDVDLEIHGLDRAQVSAVIGVHQVVREVGRHFPVLRRADLDVDIGVVSPDASSADTGRAIEVAARRRDLTVNALAYDLGTGRLLDPLGGLDDLRTGRLRAADPRTFADDPLRVLRVARLAVALEATPTPELETLCREVDPTDAAPERVLDEIERLLRAGARPARGLAVLERTGGLRVLPEVAALRGVPQDPRWHPEGDVWIHTLLCLDAAAGLRTGAADDRVLMLATLLHDIGKPPTTRREGDRVRATGHEIVGAEMVGECLGRLRAPLAVSRAVTALVAHHLAPSQLARADAGAGAYRRLVRRLAAAGTDPRMLERLARADHLGRTTDDARRGRYPEGAAFLAATARAGVLERPRPDAVLGRHLLARGLSPGPHLGPILARCRALQDDTGLDDPQVILDRVLAD